MPSGTIEGSISILGSRDMRVLVKVNKAHLGIVTSLAFSQDSRSVPVISFCFSWWIRRMQSLIVVIMLYISGPCCLLPSTQLQGWHWLDPQRALVCRKQIFSSWLVANLKEYPKRGCLFSDRYKPVVHDTDYHSRNFGMRIWHNALGSQRKLWLSISLRSKLVDYIGTKMSKHIH